MLDKVHLLLGYKADLVKSKHPDLPYFMIKRPDKPQNLMTGLRDLFEQMPDSDYTIILGDTVWRMRSLERLFDPTHTGPLGLGFFGDQWQVGGEIFAFKPLAEAGNKIIREICKEQPLIASNYGNLLIRKGTKPVKAMMFHDARLNDFLTHMRTLHDDRLRKIVVSDVVDIDKIDEYTSIKKRIKKGIYGY